MTVDDESEQGEQGEEAQDPAPPAPPARATEPAGRPAPRAPGTSEKGLGLEVARLFGMDPRLLVAPRPRPAPRPTEDDPEDSGQTPDD